MKQYNSKKIREFYGLKGFGAKGWLSSKSLRCPNCHKTDKVGIKFTNEVNGISEGGIVNCFKCEHSTSLYSFLIVNDKKDWIISGGEVDPYVYSGILKKIGENKEKKEDKDVLLPLGYKLLVSSDYLSKRGFLPEHYQLFEPGISLIDMKLKNKYIIYLLKEGGKTLSWLARSVMDKHWHKKNLEDFKEGKTDLVLRYLNSEGTKFDELLGGIDDITENTHTLFLVEGLFDKVGADNKMNLYQSEDIRCCFTFGNKISDKQIDKIRKFKNIKNVILLYDYLTIQQSRTSALRLSNYFNTLVGEIIWEDSDPGDMSFEQYEFVLANLKNALDFFNKRIVNRFQLK